MYLGSNSFTNTGKIDVSNGDWVLFVAPTDGSITGHQTGGSVFTNLANGVLTGGIYEVDVGSTMDMPFNQPIVADVATIILSGANSLIESDNTNTGKEVTLESSLTTIRKGGALEILASRGYTTTNAISNSGTLQLGGGVFSSGTLADAAGSLLTGFGTIASIFADSGAVTASGGALMFIGNGDTFAGALGGTTIDFAGGTDLLTTGARLTATAVGITSGATLTLGENLMFAGDLSQGSGTTLALGAYTLNLAGTETTLSGTVTGTGLLYFNGGAQSVEGGANLGVSTWTITNSAATSIDESLSFAGAFTAQAGATLAIATGDTLAMTGAAGIRSGAAVEGSGALSLVDGILNDMAVGGTLTLVDAHLVSQSGAITLGDSLGDAATLLIDSGATYRIVGNVGIARGTSAASTLVNDGVFIRASGTGISTIGVAVTDAGMIDAATGTLDFSQAVGGAGSLRIYAAGTLEADAAVAATLTTMFISPGGTLALGDASGFAARISKFAAGDTIDLIDTAATKATLKAGDKLQITDGSQTVATLQLAGSYAGDSFNVGSDGHGGSAITVTTADAPMMPNPAQFAQAMASLTHCSGLALGAVTLHADRALMLATPVQRS